MTDTANSIIQRWSELLSERSAREDKWRKLVRYFFPQEAENWGVNPDGPPTSPTVDDTGREVLDNLVAGLDEMLFRRDPFEVVPRDDRAMEMGGYAAEWAAYATHNLNAAIDHPRSGWTTARQSVLRSTAGLGHGCMFISDVPGKHLICKYEPASEIVIGENAYGIVDTRMRRYPMTVRQVVETWGDRASPRVRQRLEKYPGEKVTILHSVHPRWEVPGASRTRMPWASVYIEEDTKHMLDEGGFMEFPFVVPRWDRSGCSAYGWSPGMTVLDEVIRVNAMGRTNLKAGQYTAEPEVYVPDGMFRRGLSQARRPGAVHSYSTNVAAANAEVRKWPSAEGLPFLLEYEHDRRNAIREAYFYFLLQPPESPNMTATEWIGRRQQMARRMGAPVGRLEQEMAEPAGKRFFGLLIRAGVIEPPQEGSFADYDVEFRSVISQGKELAVAESIQRTLEGAALVAQFDPRAAAVVDSEETIRELAKAFGAPLKVLASRERVQAMREAEAKQQQMAALGQTAITGATVAKLAADAESTYAG
ncbi:MAG: hypothetical protein IPK79_01280 [Vampirovibrionales bacterium]|nr:hypothetical protein [Vampirovibrionales bacterium]